MSDSEGKFVNTLLDAETLGEFEQVKQHYGMKSSSDVVRFLIRKEARRLAQTVLVDPMTLYHADAQEA